MANIPKLLLSCVEALWISYCSILPISFHWSKSLLYCFGAEGLIKQFFRAFKLLLVTSKQIYCCSVAIEAALRSGQLQRPQKFNGIQFPLVFKVAAKLSGRRQRTWAGTLFSSCGKKQREEHCSCDWKLSLVIYRMQPHKTLCSMSWLWSCHFIEQSLVQRACEVPCSLNICFSALLFIEKHLLTVLGVPT